MPMRLRGARRALWAQLQPQQGCHMANVGSLARKVIVSTPISNITRSVSE
jgi:hypothetical protein